MLDRRFAVESLFASERSQMQPYARLNPDSGVIAFEPGDNFIRVQFIKSSVIYTYTIRSAGLSAIQEMNRLAIAGKGLATFITQSKPPYESKTG